jgi:hypothetical protein
VYKFWTIVKILLGKCQALQPEEAAHGEEEQAAHQRRPTVHSSRIFFLSGRGATGLRSGGSLTARQAAARHDRITTMKITKGGVHDE